MRDDVAVRLEGVTKIYRLYHSQRDQLLEVLGLNRLPFMRIQPAKEFRAIDDVSFEVPRGGRLAIIGRNGAGKTTLLKLISGNFSPTAGAVKIGGTVQALMGTGLGFHPEFSGRANIKASLQFNGLSRDELGAAVEDIVDFCELGEFLDQPFKTYSLGMQSRLMFATATSIRPDILIVDEVLGAGDAYFSAKSSARMQRLASSGCTLLLVSHSTAQVLQFCEQAVWLEKGRVQMIGDAFQVVKKYEEFINNRRSSASWQATQLSSVPEEAIGALDASSRKGQPRPEQMARDLVDPTTFHFVAPGGISRWEGEPGIKVSGLAILSNGVLSDSLVPLQEAEIIISLVAERSDEFRCTYGLVVHDALGNVATRLISPPDVFSIQAGEFRSVRAQLHPNRLGPGEYTLGISVLEATTVESLNAARRYDLLGRSFRFLVNAPDSESAGVCNYYHEAAWQFAAVGDAKVEAHDAY
jgi:lipopolysaccharide transport system ATP-binding protein